MVNLRKMQETLELIARDGDETSKAIAAEALKRPVMACPNCGEEIVIPTSAELRRATEIRARENEPLSDGEIAEPAPAAGFDSDPAR